MTATGHSSSDVDAGIEEIYNEYRTGGENGGMAFLTFWTQMLRDQNLKSSVLP